MAVSFARFAGLFIALACLLTLSTLALPSHAAERKHGLSIFGELKYPPGFKHFEYVNPDAPKGGRLATLGGISFDTFNPFILKGDKAAGLGLMFDSLMESSADEPTSVYGLVAESAEYSDDGLSLTFYLRPEAKFRDGTQVTAADVAFSFEILRTKGHPAYRAGLQGVEKAEVIDDQTVRYTFDPKARIRDLPLTVAGLPILSKDYYAKDEHDFEKTTLEPPVGSGPYELVDYNANSYVLYKRREDYWAKDLPVMKGRYNFDELRFNYYKDRTAWFLGLTSAEYDVGEEFTSKRWATEYDSLPAIKDGRLKRITLPDDTPSGVQGWFINTRRDKFKDPRVRQAIGLAFDFEWANRNLFFNAYRRTTSFFQNTPMQARPGKPSPEVAALLEPYRDKLPPEVFGELQTPPVSDGSGSDRKLLRKADKLLREAGWELDGRRRVNDKGEQLTIEFIRAQPSFDRIIAPFVKNLELLGIDAHIRPVDDAQLQRRVKSFDFDIVSGRFRMSLTPGNELRNMFSSAFANEPGTNNRAGISDPVVDALIDKIMAAENRDELNIAVRALDRVLMAGYYWVPNWFKASHNVAFWNKFDWPKVKPKYARGIIDRWWYDAEKAANLEQN